MHQLHHHFIQHLFPLFFISKHICFILQFLSDEDLYVSFHDAAFVLSFYATIHGMCVSVLPQYINAVI